MKTLLSLKLLQLVDKDLTYYEAVKIVIKGTNIKPEQLEKAVTT